MKIKQTLQFLTPIGIGKGFDSVRIGCHKLMVKDQERRNAYSEAISEESEDEKWINGFMIVGILLLGMPRYVLIAGEIFGNLL